MNACCHAALEPLRRGLIVSCQAEDDDPFNDAKYVALFARVAEMGGAVAIRAEGAANIKAIRSTVALPIVGIKKSKYPDGSVLITGELQDVEDVFEAGASILAADATSRLRPNGMRGYEFAALIKRSCDICLIADVASLEEGKRSEEAGADAVATTLSGYTPETLSRLSDEPDWELLEGLLSRVHVPVLVEGRVWTPEQAARAIAMGAFAVVVGTAITRPRLITAAFVQRMTRVF
jgi:N-acylglucosamine-6-phosphate 2-epimerase